VKAYVELAVLAETMAIGTPEYEARKNAYSRKLESHPKP